jgi:hypothetical protein
MLGVERNVIFSKTFIPSHGSIQSPSERYSLFFSRGVKWPGHEDNHVPPSSSEVKNKWSYTSTPAVCIFSVYKENFTFYRNVYKG